MSISKIVALEEGNPLNSTGSELADSINRIIDSIEKGFATVRFSELVEDPDSRDSVDAAVTALNGILKDDDVVDLSGSYVWPTVNFTTGTKNNIKYKNGTFKRLDNIGVEYLFWLNGEDSSVSYCNFDGGSTVIPTWGQQCIYIPESINAKVHANTFKNIGDGAVRFARNTDDIVSLTKKVIISNNMFKDCGQITSNNTGVEELLVNGNIFDNTPIKITQRQSLTGSGSATITGNVFTQNSRNAKVLEVQGGENVTFQGNYVNASNLSSLIGMYPNTSIKVGELERILIKNISISNNHMVLKDMDYILYIEGKDGVDDAVLLNSDSFINIDSNKIHHTNDIKTNTVFVNLYTQNTIASAPSSLAKNATISNNKLYGEIGKFVRLRKLSFNNGDKVLVNNNYCEKATISFCSNNVNSSDGNNGKVVLDNNAFSTPRIFENVIEAAHTRVKRIDFTNNNVVITDQLDPNVSSGVCEIDFEHIYKQYKFIGNTVESESGEYIGNYFNVIPPETTDSSVGTQLWFSGNTLVKDFANTTLTEVNSLVIESTLTDGTIEQLYCNNNKYGGSLVAPVSNETSIAIGDINLTSF